MESAWEWVKQWIAAHKRLAITSGLALLVLVLVGTYGLHRMDQKDEVVNASEWETTASSGQMTSDSSSISHEQVTASAASEQWYVDVKGAVNHPGVYPVTPAMRIHDVIALAGGVKAGADETQVNFSQKVADQMVIYMPKQGEVAPQANTPGQVSAAEGASGGGQQVNLNTATKEELMTISGIGEKKAEDILHYREQNGSFQSVDDLTKVTGIGAKILEKLRAQVCV